MRYKKKKIYNFLDDILVSFIFFTVLPLHKYRSNSEKPNYTRSQWAFPLVGIFIGLVIVFIVKFSLFLGLNLVIASTLGVLFNIYILGFLENRQASNFSKKQNSDNLRTESTETGWCTHTIAHCILLQANDQLSFTCVGRTDGGTYAKMSVVMLHGTLTT